MNNRISIKQAQEIMKDNFIGPNELDGLNILKLDKLVSIPDIPFSVDELAAKKDKYLLILGISTFYDGKEITIRNLREVFGQNPDISEPCFYNQDWYEKESFIDVVMKEEWFLVRKNIYEESRAVQPERLIQQYKFPSAILCTYAFFVAWLSKGIKLWYHDFVWCNDTDHNGDRIYVGKYHDIDGLNKNGFSIHRHLALRNCYGCID